MTFCPTMECSTEQSLFGGIDLPLKALIWEDTGGKVWVSYNSPEYLQRRHSIPGELLRNIAGIGPLLQKVVG